MVFEIIRSKRRTVTISVKGGKVILRGPLSISDKEAESIINKHEDWIKKKLDASQAVSPIDRELDGEEIKRLKKAAKEYFLPIAQEISKYMGLKYGRITITGAKTRFGSCSSKGNISFSYRLMLYPEAAREYVIVHELAHLLEMNHSKRFYAIVEKYLPDYKLRRKLLKR